MQYLRGPRGDSALDLYRVPVKGGIDDYRDVPCGFICFEVRSRFISGHSGQTEVHENQIRVNRTNLS